jgi:hypothetical protein
MNKLHKLHKSETAVTPNSVNFFSVFSIAIMSKLLKQDLVGHCIADIYQSPYVIDSDGFGGCRVFVELDSGVAFELKCAELEERRPPKSVDIDSMVVLRCSDSDIRDCVGEIICDVLMSDYWPAIGIATHTDRLIYLAAFPNPNFSGGMLTGPFADKINSTYGWSDVESCVWD